MKRTMPAGLYRALACLLAAAAAALCCLCLEAAEEKYYLKWDVSPQQVSRLSD